MPRTPDRRAGPLDEEEILLETTTYTTDPTVVGAIRYHQTEGAFKAKDGTGVFNLRSGSGLSESQHKALRHLIHFIDNGPADGFSSGAYKETLPTADPFPTSIIWWESSSKLKKIVEKTITRSGGGATIAAPTPIIWEMYGSDGLIVARATDDVTYSGVFELSRVRTIEVVTHLSSDLDVNIG
jgi:hypothetical protein